MDEQRKRAYRYLLHWSTIDIRPIGQYWSAPFYGVLRRALPFVWPSERRQIQRAGLLAGWLHGLSRCSANEFEGFEEQWFWDEYETLCARRPDLALRHYRGMFEMWLHTPVGEMPTGQAWLAAMSGQGPAQP